MLKDLGAYLCEFIEHYDWLYTCRVIMSDVITHEPQMVIFMPPWQQQLYFWVVHLSVHPIFVNVMSQEHHVRNSLAHIFTLPRG